VKCNVRAPPPSHPSAGTFARADSGGVNGGANGGLGNTSRAGGVCGGGRKSSGGHSLVGVVGGVWCVVCGRNGGCSTSSTAGGAAASGSGATLHHRLRPPSQIRALCPHAPASNHVPTQHARCKCYVQWWGIASVGKGREGRTE
jgi:hypothetical protein